MNIVTALLKTSIGKKIIMALTGAVLIGFIIGHLVGNLQIFSDPEKINAYAHFLQGLGPALWLIRLFLLLCVGLHIWMAVLLWCENKKARSQSYTASHTIQASYASRTMKYSGFIVLAFILYHLAHFTVKATNPEYNEMMWTLADGTVVPDVHLMMVAGFSSLTVSLFYLISVGLLSFHLSHGFQSMFQSVGLRTETWGRALKVISIVLSLAYFAGNAVIPLSVLTGKVSRPDSSIEAVAESVSSHLNTPSG
ncbi:MAG: succinate dehydrogenase cytochrome b subunit [Opitutaceae bacterium]|nr:succinate dehydrogenase cytochrome b subunit [Opitutaceae bacterium]